MQFRPGQIDGVEINLLNRFSDERGWLAELYRSDEVRGDSAPAMGYVSVTKPGVTRGPHEHLDQSDRFCFAGPGEFEVRMWDNRSDSPTYLNSQTVVVGEDNPTIIVVPPGVVHGYRNIGDGEAMVINLPNRLYAGEGRKEEVDEIRHESSGSSPFHMDDLG
jgi:dTDP-4-dehydrorhamnose 3,5-epimerase